MLFQYLGTGASEGFPGMFCTCETCRKARNEGGRSIRSRSQAVIDGKLLIDFPADTNLHIINDALDLTGVIAIIITHCHEDHFYPADLVMRNPGLAHLNRETLLQVYAVSRAIETAKDSLAAMHLPLPERLSFVEIVPFSPFSVGGYEVTPMKANHALWCDPVIYLIEDGEKRVLYGHDSGYFPAETWQYLEAEKPYLNLVSLDCTEGINPTDFGGHMSIYENVRVRERLLDLGCADRNTIFCCNHFSHNGLATYQQMCAIASGYGFRVSYDGMKIDL